MKKIIGLTLSLLALVLVFLGARPDQTDITKLSVVVSCGEYYGCGTVYDRTGDDLVIVSARHILEDYFSGVSTDIKVGFSDGTVSNASLIKEDTGLDIVFLSVKRDLKGPYVKKKSAASPAIGEPVYLVDSNTSDVYAGSVASPSIYSEDFGMDMIYCYCLVTPGMSGTGLFDEEGRYLGILLGGSDEAEAVCLDASAIYEAYNN